MKKKSGLFLIFCSIILLAIVSSKAGRISLNSKPPFYHYKCNSLKKEYQISGTLSSISRDSKLPDSMYAKSYCILDANTNQVILGKDYSKKMPMASTTKIMTCIIALEKSTPKSKAKVSSYAASMPKVKLNMHEGQSFYIKDLLYSLMLESHNDSAVAIAEHIGGSVENFAKLMNEKARLLGCKSTNFVTPNGLDDKAHYTTAKELCIIASYAIKNKEFRKIINTKSYHFSDLSGKSSYNVYNHDAFLNNYPGAIGIKTGFTGNAGYCFCGAAKKNNRTLISAVLACGWPPHKTYKWNDTKKLMNYGFHCSKNISIKRINLPNKIPLYGGNKSALKIYQYDKSDLIFTLCNNDKISCKIQLPDKIYSPTRKGDILGYEKYYKNNELLYEFPIIAKENSRKRNFSYYFSLIKKIYFFN